MFGLFKSNEEKKLAFFNKLRTETAIKLKKSFMNSVIITNGYNELVNDEFVGSKGKFGYDKTNPISNLMDLTILKHILIRLDINMLLLMI